ncbi:hypothetical protein L227DRAFT_33168 [Lentinus tigrinus ALCF2SS1-6]|uniref:Uncharacterized protein n=1 Tax=Lentinus tigrinus ALCF2SS1-6 TaxID=1328759 RepID=A0A5C2SLJ8_9APHY|nr:hypothetical protein L227DRAFT_33168 [Lentinus tigrinus ALCF2SS1-6]
MVSHAPMSNLCFCPPQGQTQVVRHIMYRFRVSDKRVAPRFGLSPVTVNAILCCPDRRRPSPPCVRHSGLCGAGSQICICGAAKQRCVHGSMRFANSTLTRLVLPEGVSRYPILKPQSTSGDMSPRHRSGRIELKRRCRIVSANLAGRFAAPASATIVHLPHAYLVRSLRSTGGSTS